MLADGRLRGDGPPRDVIRPDVLSEVYGHPVDVIDHAGRLVVLPHLIPHAPVKESSCAVAPS